MFHPIPRLLGLMGVIASFGLLSAGAFAQDTANGAAVFGGTCVACHGQDGGGAFTGIPDLARRLGKSDDDLFTSIREGFESPGSMMAMPANGGNRSMSDEDIRDVIAYMREAFGSN